MTSTRNNRGLPAERGPSPRDLRHLWRVRQAVERTGYVVAVASTAMTGGNRRQTGMRAALGGPARSVTRPLASSRPGGDSMHTIKAIPVAALGR